MLARRIRSAVAALLLAGLAALCMSPPLEAPVDVLPDHLTDASFWNLITTLSESGGYFRSDNLISNEETFQYVIPALRGRLSPGGVYLGVGPDQNFTYLIAVQPKMAFIVDIRRQNLLLHLMYKALIELSADRVELLSRLFSRPPPSGLDNNTSAAALFAAYEPIAPSEDLFTQYSAAITDRLLHVHGFALSDDDLRSIAFVYRAFFAAGPGLRYSFPRQFGGGGFANGFPTYAELMTATDAEGEPHSYLATEHNYQALRGYEMNNLVVPVVGDFGGSKALRAIGRYLKTHDASVTLFYTSNVEQYLFQSSAWRRFFDNIAALPLDPHSALLRSFFNTGYQYGGGPGGIRNVRSTMLVDSIPSLLGAVRAGHVQSYYDVIERSR